MRYIIPLALLVTSAAFVGCADSTVPTTDSVSNDNESEAILTSVNSHCPIMGGEVTADGGRVEWNGKTIGFCCPDCIEKFESLSDDDKANALANSDEKHEVHDHDDHDHGSQGDGDHEGEPS